MIDETDRQALTSLLAMSFSLIANLQSRQGLNNNVWRIQNLAYVGIITGAVAVGAVVVFTAAHLPIGYDVPAPRPLPLTAERLQDEPAGLPE